MNGHRSHHKRRSNKLTLSAGRLRSEALKAKPEADASDAGLGAMRAAIAATEEAALRQLIAKDEAADGVQLPPLRSQSLPSVVANRHEGWRQARHRHRASRAVSPGDAKWHVVQAGAAGLCPTRRRTSIGPHLSCRAAGPVWTHSRNASRLNLN